MAVREIKTTLTLDGEKQFENEIKDASRSLRVMGSEMKSVSADYDLTGDRATYLAQRSQILKSQLAQQKEIFRALSQAAESSAKSTGEASAKTDLYRIRMNSAAASVAKLERELRDTDREMEELGRDSAKVGRQIEQGIGDAAEETAKSLDEMYAKLKDDIGSIKGSSMISALSDVGGTIGGVWETLSGFEESTRSYNRQLAFLEQNARTAGQDYETVKKLLLQVTGLTGEMDGAIEGASSLLMTGFDTSQMELAISSLAGAVIAFPETFKFENLATDLQESIATGEATGAFAELLDRTKISTDDFALAMSAATSEEERLQVALSFLHQTGLSQVYDDFVQTNPQLIEAQEASDRLGIAFAELGETVSTWTTPIKDGMAGAVEDFTAFLNALQDPQVGSNVGTFLETFHDGFNPNDLEAAGEEVAEETEAVIEDTTQRMEEASAQAMLDLAQSAAPFVQSAAEKAGALFDTVWGKTKEILRLGIGEVPDISGYGVTDEMLHAFLLPQPPEKESVDIFEAFMIDPATAAELEATAKTAGEDTGEAMTEAAKGAIDAGATDMETTAETAAANAMAAAADGIRENGQDVVDAAAEVVNAVNETLNQMQPPSLDGVSEYYHRVPRNPNGAGNINHRPTQTVVQLNLDGKKLATVMTPHVSGMQGRDAQRAAAIYG